MCNPLKSLFGGGGGGGSDAAAVARQQEERRAQRVREGTQAINQQFAQFDPAFFQGVEQSALDFFNPQVDDQFFGAREGLIKNLARGGNLSGSVGARRLGDLTEELATQRARIADKARGFAQGARADVEGNRASLIQNLAATADPFSAANAAAAQARALSAPPEFNPLGDLFVRFENIATPQIIAARSGFSNPASALFPSLQPRTTTVS